MRVSAGDLNHKVAFDQRSGPDDEYGNPLPGDFKEVFQSRAAFRHLHGTEAVMASRLAGKHTQIITVRSRANTRLITTDWRVRDIHTGQIFAIQDVTHNTDRQFIDILAVTNVAP
jgi:SPP1 family predicted phage head-tail adaptor